MTTLYFEASDEDDLRKTGFSKDGKHHCPQIMIGLLGGLGGYLPGYDIYEGNTCEGDTLIPFIKKISERFSLGKPTVIADSGLLSDKNIIALEADDYEYIIGARIKNKSRSIKNQILTADYQSTGIAVFEKENNRRLLVSFAENRAKKDKHNRGYNKYLKLEGQIDVRIDHQKFIDDAAWDGLKGYITNSKLANDCIIDNYKNLWHIERAFRMSKTDLRIPPIYHHLRRRIEAHVCISFIAYCIYKELERALHESKSELSLKQAAEITHNIYQITYQLPESKLTKSQLLKMNLQQAELIQIINQNF